MIKIKKIHSLFLLASLALPNVALAAEKSAFHAFYESTFGPVGAIAGIIAMVAFWQASKKADPVLSSLLKMLVFVLLFINIGSLSFGIHGSGLISGEVSRYIERICRLIALLLADVAALSLFMKMNKNNQNIKKEQAEKE
ncbi:hypothetical protein KAU09_05205 [Candidatus Parcubacteria bacterium]|nr:hypothetical protein [Candidatus Parcubacteria bacterium]